MRATRVMTPRTYIGCYRIYIHVYVYIYIYIHTHIHIRFYEYVLAAINVYWLLWGGYEY